MKILLKSRTRRTVFSINIGVDMVQLNQRENHKSNRSNINEINVFAADLFVNSRALRLR